MQLDFGGLTSVAAIIAATLVLVQTIKGWSFLDRVPTQIVAIVVGAALTFYAVYSGQIAASPVWWLVVQVIMGVVGAPGIYGLFKKDPPIQ